MGLWNFLYRTPLDNEGATTHGGVVCMYKSKGYGIFEYSVCVHVYIHPLYAVVHHVYTWLCGGCMNAGKQASLFNNCSYQRQWINHI